MRKVVALILFFLAWQISFGQHGLFGIKVIWTPNERYLNAIDGPTGTVTTLSPNSIFEWYHFNGATTIDANNDLFYAIVTHVHPMTGNDPYHLMGIDLNTGNVAVNTFVHDTNLVKMPRHNCLDSTLYGIKSYPHPNAIDEYNFLAKIDPQTGNKTLISPSSVFSILNESIGTTIDPYNKIFYAGSMDAFSVMRLTGIDLNTGMVVSNPIIGNNDLYKMVFNPADTTIYGIQVSNNSQDRKLVKIDPVSGQLTVISPFSIFNNYHHFTGATIDPGNGIYYIRSSSPQDALLGIDLTTGLLVSNVPLTNPDDYHQFVFNWDCELDSILSVSNTCFGNNTQFQANSCSQSLEWDFGDPASGPNNTSTLMNPTHIFSDTGYFNVTLKARTFCGRDSITQTIYISPADNFTFSVGNDTILCPGDSLLLDATTSNTSYLWNDQSTDSTLLVNQSGTYWVNLSRCNSADTIQVNYLVEPELNIKNDTSLCPGGLIFLDASYPNASYLWQDNSTDSVYFVTQPGTYWVRITYDCGVVFDTVNVNNNAIPVNLGQDITLCNGDSVTLFTGYSGYDHIWSDLSTGYTYTENWSSMTSSDTIWVQVSNNNGCGSDTIVVYHAPLFANWTLSNPGPLCPGDSLLLAPSNINVPVSYLWSNNSTDSSIIVTQPGTYSLQLSSPCFTNSNSVTILAGQPPYFDLGNDTSICDNETLTLLIPNTSDSIYWFNGTSNTSVVINSSGIFFAEVFNECGYFSDTINVLQSITPVFNLGEDTTICHGDSVNINGAFSGATYLWSNGSTDSSIWAYQNGTYWVITTLGGCDASDTINISTMSSPNFSIVNESPYCFGDLVSLSAYYPNSSYLWSDSTQNSSLFVDTSGTYWVLLSNQCGSQADTTIVMIEDCDVIIEIPNTFTPNSDYINDIFSPISIEGIENLSTQIFNRWGQLIFESQFLNIGWNGRTNAGAAVPEGTYFYVLKYTDRNGEKGILKGFITLSR